MEQIVGMEMIKKNALVVYDGMVEITPQHGTRSGFSFVQETVRRIGDRKYCMNNSTLAFIVEGEMYVTPFTQAMMDALYGEHFGQDYFYVPFSNWGYPERERGIWEQLVKLAKQRRHEEFVEDCRVYCAEQGLGGEIAPEVLNSCMEIPACGVEVEHPYFSQTYYPQVRHFGTPDIDKLGRYNTNNSVIVFNTNDARTFITRDWGVLDTLMRAGYRQAGLFVPMSNGERIVHNYALANRWDALVKAAG